MNNRGIYEDVCARTSRLTTRAFSTSFSLGIASLDQRFHAPIYGIYGFVRFADEIVDTFLEHDQEQLLDAFTHDTCRAIEARISLNPILHSFQLVVHQYGIGRDLIDAFLQSMRTDLHRQMHDDASLKAYIFGSAEAVGLMCLKVFAENDERMYEELKVPAMKLGSAFQKVNFLRDLRQDSGELGRTYFPGIDPRRFDAEQKRAVESDIQSEFDAALKGIALLPPGARRGVRLAFLYYQALFRRIQRTPAHRILQSRISVPNRQKMGLLLSSYIQHRLNIA